MIILQHNVFFEDNALGLQYFWDILYKLSFNNKLSCNLLFWLTQSFNPIFTDIFLECSAYIVRNESFNKSNNFKKEFGCRMCIYTKLFTCITIVKELAQNRHFFAFSSKFATSGPYKTRIKYSVHSVGLVKVQSRTTLKSSHPFLYYNHPVLELGYIFNIYNDGNPGKIIMLRKISSAKETKRFSPFNILSSL